MNWHAISLLLIWLSGSMFGSIAAKRNWFIELAFIFVAATMLYGAAIVWCFDGSCRP